MSAKEDTMIELTPEQVLALEREPSPARVVDPRGQTAYVLVREDVYRRMQALLEDEVDMAAVAVLVEEAMREDDAKDPTLEYYQRTYGRWS
jgi:hypothetical protein